MTKPKRPKRPPEIDEAVKQLRAASRAELAKKEVVQFRMDTEDLQQLYQVCARHKKPVGTLVREWVLYMTAQEMTTSESSQKRAKFGHELLVHEVVSEPGLLGQKKHSSKPTREQMKLQSLYERFMSCRQEEMAIVNELLRSCSRQSDADSDR